jgi:uncharacterized membrane protein
MHDVESGAHDPSIVRGFRHRGHRHVSRIEGFSDAVFGLSVTLLIVSLEVPKTFDEVLHTLSGFPAFALTFALLAQIWYLQYRFFRRYGLEDAMTIVLNLALLFVVVFFTYPLKFLFSVAVSGDVPQATIRGNQLVQMYVVYGAGYAAVFAIFLLLHAHALRKRVELSLTAMELLITRRSMVLAGFQIFVAAASVGAAAYFNARHDYAGAGRAGGLAYLLIPVLVTIVEAVYGRKMRRMADASIEGVS